MRSRQSLIVLPLIRNDWAAASSMVARVGQAFKRGRGSIDSALVAPNAPTSGLISTRSGSGTRRARREASAKRVQSSALARLFGSVMVPSVEFRQAQSARSYAGSGDFSVTGVHDETRRGSDAWQAATRTHTPST